MLSAGSPVGTNVAWKHSSSDRPSSAHASAEATVLLHWQSAAQAASCEAHTPSAHDQHASNDAFDGWNVKMSVKHPASPREEPPEVDVDPDASSGSIPRAESRAPDPESGTPAPAGAALLVSSSDVRAHPDANTRTAIPQRGGPLR